MNESGMLQEIPEFVNDGDWVERFIQEVQNRPPIYNTKLPQHSDRNLVLRLWSEIYETMVPTWSEMSPSEKLLKGKELQNRWRNLKTCFRRELNKQKHGKSGQSATKRRKYVFFDQLLFLLPTIEDRPTVSECSPANSNEDKSESEDGSEVVKETNTYINDTSVNSLQARQSEIHKKSSAKKKLSYEESLLNILKEKKEEVIDEDKSFLLSLVPAFKKLTDTQKIDAKMEFLSTLRRITLPRQEAFYNMPLAHNTNSNYGFHTLAQQNQRRHFNFNTGNYSSGSSTPNPIPSSSSYESTTPQSLLEDMSSF